MARLPSIYGTSTSGHGTDVRECCLTSDSVTKKQRDWDGRETKVGHAQNLEETIAKV